MFCRTVSHGKTPYSWNMTPRSGPGPFTDWLLNNTRPVVGCWNPASIFIMVVLPQPEGPMIATNSASPMSYETSSTTGIVPLTVMNSRETFSNRARTDVDREARLLTFRRAPANLKDECSHVAEQYPSGERRSRCK